ncbi:MAG: mobile mystery protein A [Gammaproteobacteria bacterium]
MRGSDRAAARRQLDKRLRGPQAEAFARPPRGWIRAIREALGMTMAQLGQRMGVGQSTVANFEINEMSGALRLNSLQRAAEALGCRLVYALVPAQSLEAMIEARARVKARDRLQRVGFSMALEDQRPDADDEAGHLEQLTRQLIEQSSSTLWDDDLE